MGELRVAALISDMDGVLIDSGGVYDRHWELWAERQGVPRERIISVHYGRPAAETIRLVAPQLDAVAEARLFNDALAAEPSAAGVSAMPGAIELLGSLPAHRWAIATSAPRVMAERWLEHVRMPLPGVLVAAEDVARGKSSSRTPRQGSALPRPLAPRCWRCSPRTLRLISWTPTTSWPGSKTWTSARTGATAACAFAGERRAADRLEPRRSQRRCPGTTWRARKRPSPGRPRYAPSSTMTLPREMTTSLPPCTSRPS